MSDVDIRPSNRSCDGSAADEGLSSLRCCLLNHSDLAVSVRTVSRAWGTGIIGRGVLTLGGEDAEGSMVVVVAISYNSVLV